jgi:hypothetical protein
MSFTMAPDAMRSRTHPSYPFAEATIRAVSPECWTHTRAILKGPRGETNGRARGGAARAVQLGCGEHGAVSGGRGGGDRRQRRRRRGRPREAHAAAHLRIVPVDVSSKADQPPELRLVAVVCGLPQFLVLLGSGLLGSGLGTAGAHVFSAVSAAREGRPTSSLTRNRSKRQAPESPKVRGMPCSARALRGKRPGCRVGRKGQFHARRGRHPGRAPELTVRASAHAR